MVAGNPSLAKNVTKSASFWQIVRLLLRRRQIFDAALQGIETGAFP